MRGKCTSGDQGLFSSSFFLIKPQSSVFAYAYLFQSGSYPICCSKPDSSFSHYYVFLSSNKAPPFKLPALRNINIWAHVFKMQFVNHGLSIMESFFQMYGCYLMKRVPFGVSIVNMGSLLLTIFSTCI